MKKNKVRVECDGDAIQVEFSEKNSPRISKREINLKRKTCFEKGLGSKIQKGIKLEVRVSLQSHVSLKSQTKVPQ